MQNVKVYYNLHNHKWSIKDIHSGLVVGHADSVVLNHVVPKVSKVGRERVLREKRKNVHAFLCGALVDLENFVPYKGRKAQVIHAEFPSSILTKTRKVSYNPYKASHFYYVDDGVEYVGGLQARLNADRTVDASHPTIES